MQYLTMLWMIIIPLIHIIDREAEVRWSKLQMETCAQTHRFLDVHLANIPKKQRMVYCCDIHPTNLGWISSPEIYDMWTMWTDLHCGTICADGSMNPEASPYPAQTSGDDRNPRKQKTTASPIDSGMISKKAKSWVQTGYVPRVATSSVFSKHREIRLTEILPALFPWSLPLLILDKALFQALVEFQEALGTPLLNDHRIGYDVSWCFT